MFTCTPATRIFIALDPVDLRASFNGLCAWVQQKLAEDPLSGHLYVFTNRKRNRLKILFWDGSGLWCCCKRLEKARFGWPKGEGARTFGEPENYGRRCWELPQCDGVHELWKQTRYNVLAEEELRAKVFGMPKTPASKPANSKATMKNADSPSAKLTTKDNKAVAHKAPERRNENKVRGR